jgi:hypothetical protein
VQICLVLLESNLKQERCITNQQVLSNELTSKDFFLSLFHDHYGKLWQHLFGEHQFLIYKKPQRQNPLKKLQIKIICEAILYFKEGCPKLLMHLSSRTTSPKKI